MALGDAISGSNPFDFTVKQTLQAPQVPQQQAPTQPFVPEAYNTQYTGRGGNPFDIDQQGYRTQGIGGQRTGQWMSPTGEVWRDGRTTTAMAGAGGQMQDKDWKWYQNELGLDPSRWESGVNPWDETGAGNSRGMRRAAMRELGFDQDFGGGRGGAFANQVGQGAIDQKINEINRRRILDQRGMLEGPAPTPWQPETGYLWDQTFTGRGGQDWRVNPEGQRVDEFNQPTGTWVSPTAELWNEQTDRPINAIVGEGGQVADKPWDWYQQELGLDPMRWEEGVNPWDATDAGNTFGTRRAAMRELGFDQDFGGGRGGAFAGEVGQEAIQQKIGEMNAARLGQQQDMAGTIGQARDAGYPGGFTGTQFPDWLSQNPGALQGIQDMAGGGRMPQGLGAPTPGSIPGQGMGAPMQQAGMGVMPSDPLSGNYSLEQDMSQFIPYMEAYKDPVVPQFDSLSDEMNRGETGYIGGFGDRADMITKDTLKDALDEIMREWEANKDSPFKQLEGKPGWWPSDTTWFNE